MDNKKYNHDHDSKTEIAKKIADQSKRVSSAYGNVEESLMRVFRWFSGLVDRIIFTKKYLPLVSLFLALFLYISVNYDSENSILASSLSSSRTLTGVSFQISYASESFEVSMDVDTCDVVLTGEAANVNSAATRTGYCQINLDGYTEGTHLVEVTVTGYGDSVTAVASPSHVEVTLSRKTSQQFEVDGYYFVNTNELDSRYVLGDVTFIDDTVVAVRASQEKLDSIVMVMALIDVGGLTETAEVEADIIAYDEQGNKVDVEIVPDTITVEVSVSSPSKIVPIVVEFTGEVPNDLAVDSVTMDNQTATIYATEEVLSTISQVTITYDASTLTSTTTTVTTPLTLPDGVSGSDVSLVTLSITLAEKETVTLSGVTINYRNNTNNYSATIEGNVTTVDVTVTGTASNIANISADDILVYIDLAGIEPGTPSEVLLQYEVSSSNSLVTYSLDQLYLTVTLYETSTSSTQSEVIE